MEARRLRRCLALVGVALAVGVVTTRGRGRELDVAAFRAANRDRGPAADRFFTGVTEFGSIWAAAAAALVLAAAGHRRAALRGFAAAAAAWLAGQGLKKAFLRPRPYEAFDDVRLLAHPPRATSWPSSHPAVLLAFLTGAGAPAAITALLPLAVGASRSHVGVHFPSDVVGGLLIGRAVGELLAARR